jgi:glycosyltransferase involved in cell wall biosynthesis
MTSSSVDITIPVLNEQRAIESTLGTLVSYLSAECPYDWRITVVDNGSTDRTWSLASSFVAADDRTRAIRLDRPGRGGALKEAWSTSSADVVAYMDVDLSTGLESLRPLLEPIVQGETDVSIGSRLAPGAAIERSVQREVISRIYNMIARRFLHYTVRDAQCGFKAMRASVARDLIPRIEDDGWFFDTELLVLAWRDGLRINEIPVHWVEDDDSRVRIMGTALDDLRGIWRLWREGRSGRSTPRRVLDNPDTSQGSKEEEEEAVDFDS